MGKMVQFLLISNTVLYLMYLCAGQQQPNTLPIRLPPTVYTSTGSSGSSCPSQDTINEEHRRVRETVLDYYNRTLPCSCGGPDWTRVAYLNMDDPNQQCPSNWTLTTTPVRGCGGLSTGISCDSVTYPVNGRTYTSVCGRINAYQKGFSSAFYSSLSLGYNNIEAPYLSGISLTHGPAGNRQHIWSFAGAISEHPSYSRQFTCPCINTNATWPYQIPTFIMNDYFCDTGNTEFSYTSITFTDDPLWDGEGCGPTNTCCSFNTPPWFCKSLPQPTSDDLEIRLCYSYRPNNSEDKLISLVDIYVK